MATKIENLCFDIECMFDLPPESTVEECLENIIKNYGELHNENSKKGLIIHDIERILWKNGYGKV